ncbi:hypothetical protein B0H11DRAFT_2269093 [Mycena galericulata]|nr:hypothetical protein B0H11DRAFT_2050171 [Mycena galericulata]KAJ7511359.1 hypothetical protein B0H11DRAFT_2269093 [Mycena galericulata]
MVSCSLAGLYQFVSLICLVQICSGIWTVYSFGLAATGISQFMEMLYMAVSIPMVHILAKYTRNDGHRFSRVDNHIRGLALLMVIWVGATCIAVVFLLAFGTETVLFPCARDMFMSSRCAPIVLDITLPIANIAIAIYAVGRIARRARQIHGVERVELPPPPPSPPTLVPAWLLGTVSETESNGVKLPVTV